LSGEKPVWEMVPQCIKSHVTRTDGTLLRLRVEGGWIYRWSHGGLSAESICFAPSPSSEAAGRGRE
jgi:hypothetical protein